MIKSLYISDKLEFQHGILIDYKPHLGFSNVLYRGEIIKQIELGRITEPIGDNDEEWERYAEILSEWKDEIDSNVINFCKEYFNRMMKY